MKLKVLIYGTGSFSQRFMDRCLDKEKAEVVAFVESRKSKDKFYDIDVIECRGGVKRYIYDLIIVISSYIEEIRDALIKNQVDIGKCVFTTDLHNWMCDKKNAYLLLSVLKNEYSFRDIKILIESQRPSTYAVAETLDNLVFLGNYADDIIGEMIDSGRSYSFDEVDAFFNLSEAFYGASGGGYFFDCGCNILTTSVYALKSRPNLKAIAFEPMKRTWRMAKANAVLNDLDSRVQVVNLGLSDVLGTENMVCNQFGCGGNYIMKNIGKDNKPQLEEVNIATLDNWLEENDFDINKVNYLWIDVEGYEGFVVNGMMSLLNRKKIPMYLEYYTQFLERSGSKEILLDCLEKIYSKYIVVRRGGIYNINDVHLIKELRDIRQMSENIFLIP